MRVSEREYQVHIDFDDEAGVWFVAQSDIPGLRLEASDPIRLIERISDAASELIELNEQRKAAQHRPAMRWRPVFDRSLDLLHA